MSNINGDNVAHQKNLEYRMAMAIGMILSPNFIIIAEMEYP
jgi:hypothetical protein